MRISDWSSDCASSDLLSAKEAATKAGEGPSVIGWALDRDQRAELLQQFPPKFVDVVADHVTLAATASPDAELPSETLGDIVGRINEIGRAECRERVCKYVYISVVDVSLKKKQQKYIKKKN